MAILGESFSNRSITNFRDRLVGGGARPNMFEVNITLPDQIAPSGDISQDMRFLVKAAEIPAANIGNIPVPFRGRVLPVAGDRTFDPWTVTVINDAQFNIRDAMEQWSNLINDLQFDVGDINPADYQTKAEVFQLSRQSQGSGGQSAGKGGEIIQTLRTYNFEGIYPNAVSSIPLDYGATDQIEEFQVTFNYLFWTTDLPGLPKGVESVSAGN
jgi:hypothetical protein|tara:strand:- start:38 stop:676 length:639 start_codon:yes stop_codon:yes gene_type:complete